MELIENKNYDEERALKIYADSFNAKTALKP